MRLIFRLALNVFALFVVAYLVPGFHLANITAAIIAAVVIGIINTFIKPIIQLVALPISIVTLGIFAFVINVALLYVAAQIVPGFAIDGFWTAALASIVLALVTWFLNRLASE